MKKTLLTILSIVALVSCSGLNDRLDSLEERVSKLESQCEWMNSDIEALRSVVDALDKADFVQSVKPIQSGGKTIGYTLEFRKSPSIDIYLGTDGGNVPQMGIRKDGDTYYWTMGDGWLLDDEGNRIRVNPESGNIPQFKTEDGGWWISCDGGTTWSKLGDELPALVKEIREDKNYVYVSLFSGTEIRLPKVGSVIVFEDPTVKMICVKHWDTDKDGELSYDEAAAVKSLCRYFRGMDVFFFNELAYFTGLEEIGEEAFYKSSLQEVLLPDSIRAIGQRAFYSTPLAGISIPETVESIGLGAFYACRSLTYANIPSSFTEVPAEMFAGCWSLEKIILPEKTTRIGEQAFHECFALADVELPSTLDTLEDRAFARCSSFTKVILPESVRTIGTSVFYECDNATRIEFPDHIDILDHMVLYGCRSLESFTVPSNVRTIGWYTFWECTGLKKLVMKPTVPPVVRTDNSGASWLFNNCPEDLKIYVPDVEAYRNDPYWSRYSDMLLEL